MRYLLFLLMLSCTASFGQHKLAGQVKDPTAGLPFATVALLHPADSTMAYFGITGDNGEWNIKNVKPGSYICQVSFLGYHTSYKTLTVPGAQDEQLNFVLQPLSQSVDEVKITGERIPVRLNQDTVEYDAGAFKTKPDAAAEDLLKKLPGVEVDRSGNIKAQGEEVVNVLVDGKEFFSNDPKVATKNLPADAIDKVQVYDKKSEQAELTGVDDGEREKTINLLLKENKKSAIFGDVSAGAGTDEHYKFSSRLYRFTQKHQMAFIGMMNDISETGFSFKDYMDFSGGMRNMSDGSSNMEFSFNNNSAPVNFGETEYGKATSGAGGLNYTYEPVKNNRINVSYMLSGKKTLQNTNIYTENFTGDGNFFSKENKDDESDSRNHTASVNFRNRVDSTQNITFNASATYNTTLSYSKSNSYTYTSSLAENQLSDNGNEDSEGLNGRVRASYLKRFTGKWNIFRVNADASINSSVINSEWNNISRFFLTGITEVRDNFRDNETERKSYGGTASITRKLGEYRFLELIAEAGTVRQDLFRSEGEINSEDEKMSYDFTSAYQYVRPAVSYKYNKGKKHFLFSLRTELLDITNSLNKADIYSDQYFYFIPRINWENEYKKGRRYSLNFNSRINQPSSTSLVPVINDRNPLSVSYGNPSLKPEYQHQFRANWNIFDQFSFTSFFSGISFRMVQDKITWKTYINDDLSKLQVPVNSGEDLTAEIHGEITTPIRKARINISIEASESWNRGRIIINEEENITDSYTHELRLTFDNRKKDKLDISVGAFASLTNSSYSIQQSSADYIQATYFASIGYQPAERWSFGATADINSYFSESFADEQLIPMISAEATWFMLKSKRLSLTVQAYDILNKNTGIDRISELNYIQEKQSDVIGRYILFSVKYRLNKFESKGNGMKIDIR